MRGIATGSSFRRSVAKSLARQFGAEVERVCAPFQLALSTRAGTDGVGHAARVVTDLDPHGVGRRSVEPHRDQGLRDSSRFGRIPLCFHAREVG